MKLTCLDWRAVRPVYVVALKRQRVAIELIVTEEMVLTAKTRMFSYCSEVLMDTVRITERSKTYSNLAGTLIVTELKTKPFSQLSPLLILLEPKVSISVVTGDHLLNQLWDAKSFPFVSTAHLTLVNRCARRVNYSNVNHFCLHTNRKL